MNVGYQLLGLVGAGLIIWWLFRTVKHRPDQFSREKISQSVTSMGVLALILIVFVALLVFLLKV